MWFQKVMLGLYPVVRQQIPFIHDNYNWAHKMRQMMVDKGSNIWGDLLGYPLWVDELPDGSKWTYYEIAEWLNDKNHKTSEKT